MNTTRDWTARCPAVAEADDEEADTLEADWKTEYTEVFIDAAVEQGWKFDDAEDLTNKIEDRAWQSSADDDCPCEVAEADALAISMERMWFHKGW